MRLLCTITSKNPEEDPYAFSAFLKTKGIDNTCEEISLPGEPPLYRIWITDEEHYAQAKQFYENFHNTPRDPYFLAPLEELKNAKEEKSEDPSKAHQSRFLSPSPYGYITIFLLTLCILLFIWSEVKRPPLIPPKIPDVVEAPVLSSIDKNLLFDYPHYFDLRDDLLKIYTPKEIQEKKEPSSAAESILRTMKSTPFWPGIYERIVNYFKTSSVISFHGPLFEKISQGEIWRLFTPALIHFNLLHIFFNLLWFIVLGNQIEFRIGRWRYIILILSTAIFSNMAQYLMSGSFFMGLSGVVVGLVGFIYARQTKAFWEGYLLNKMTFIFLFAFVFGMFVLQLIFFFFQIFTKYNANIAIANTAHIVGGLVGYLLGCLRFFSLKPPSEKKSF